MRKLFASAELRGRGSICFELPDTDGGQERARAGIGYSPTEGFAVRSAEGVVRAYVNKCPHRGQPVDLGDGKLYSRDGLLECQAHGAYFDPSSGRCVRGPCEGESLTSLGTEERDGAIWLRAEPALVDDYE